MKLNLSIGSTIATVRDETNDTIIAEYSVGVATLQVNIDNLLQAIITLLQDK
jgi:hypothetical protein